MLAKFRPESKEMHCGSAPPIDCIEPDFTVSGAAQWDRRLSNRERAEVLFAPPAETFGRTVVQARKGATDPKWPLANYWPVYLSNFMVKKWDETTWYDQVSDYFAYHGFETRMIYFHTLDTDYLRVQKKNCLIEALVYFGSEEECERAIATCHRKQHYGHRLNVLPGRTPEYLDNERAVRFVQKKCQKSESFLELFLIPFGKVELAIRHSEGNILVQFKSKEDMIKALPSQTHWKPLQLKGPVRIQRYLEAEVKMGIKWVIESQGERFIERRPRPRMLQYFEDGIHPIAENTWSRLSIPKISKAMYHEKKAAKTKLRQLAKRKRIRNNFDKYMKSKEYQKMSESEKQALHEEVFKNHGFDPTVRAPGKPKGVRQTRKQKQASVLKSVNYFMKQDGKPLLKKADQEERRNEVNQVVQMIRDAASHMD